MGFLKGRGAAKEPVAFTFSDGPVGLSFVRHTLRTKHVAAVLDVVAGSQAQTQGVEPGMVLVEVGGHSVQGVDYNGCMAILEREVKNRPLVLTFGADLVGAVELAESDAAEEAAQRLKLERRLETLTGAHKAALDALREELSTPSTPQVQGAALDVVEQDAEIKTLRDAYNVSQARLAEADAEMKARASEGGASTEAMAERHAEALQGMRDQVHAANAEGDLLRAEIAEAKLALQERVQASAEAEAKAAKEQAESQRKLGELGAQAKNLATRTDEEKDAVLVAKDEALASARVEAEQLRTEFGTLTETTAAAATELKQRHAEALKAAQAERMVALADAAQAAQGERDAQLQQLQELQEKHRAFVEKCEVLVAKNATLAEMHANTESLLAEAETKSNALSIDLQAQQQKVETLTEDLKIKEVELHAATGTDEEKDAVLVAKDEALASARVEAEQLRTDIADLKESTAHEIVMLQQQHAASIKAAQEALADAERLASAQATAAGAELTAAKDDAMQTRQLLAEAEAKAKSLAQDLQARVLELQTAETDLAAAVGSDADRGAAIKAKDQALADARAEVERLQSEATELRARATTAETVLTEQRTKEMKATQDDHATTKRLLSEAEAKCQKMAKDLQGNEAKLAAAAGSDAEKVAANTTREQALTSARAEVEKLRGSLAEARDQYELLERNLVEADGQAQTLGQELQARVVELMGKETELKEAMGALAEQDAARAAREDILTRSRVEVEHLRSSLANAKRLALAQAQSTSTELNTAKEEIEMLKLRLKVLEETGKEASKSLKKALEAKEATLETARRTQQAAAEAAAKQQTMEINEAVEHDMSLPSRGRKLSPRLDPIATVQRLGGASRAQTSGATERPSSPQFSSNASSRRRMARKRQHQQQKEMQEAWASNGPAQITLSGGSRVSSHSPRRLAPAVSGKRVMALNHQTKPILARAGLLRVSRMLVPSPERPTQPPRRRSAKKGQLRSH